MHPEAGCGVGVGEEFGVVEDCVVWEEFAIVERSYVGAVRWVVELTQALVFEHEQDSMNVDRAIISQVQIEGLPPKPRKIFYFYLGVVRNTLATDFRGDVCL